LAGKIGVRAQGFIVLSTVNVQKLILDSNSLIFSQRLVGAAIAAGELLKVAVS
jgi:hypothetical protein